MSRNLILPKLLVLAAIGLIVATACSSIWSAEDSSEALDVNLDQDASKVFDVDVLLKRTSDDELPCGKLEWFLDADWNDANSAGTLLFELTTFALGEPITAGELTLEEGPESILASGKWTATRPGFCRARVQLVLTATDVVEGDLVLEAIAADTSSGPDDEPGPTRFTISVEESVDEAL